ncbi:Transglycosylase SLT domain-containing protein [Pustulibacterium marinum]|uniref:Transglycosylase SLT domain-containing protein n=1 Tax=Pustulibacterium marinum TaxID=1224947 RepID=A0A1I7G550_9FLAO|nr:lytic transglycosylase domain-containing protein [Pustulibacterium marinum]SFU43481.1 Transglycosylase SLT domain-containing protein [Pustulibacterium marinum]
MRLIKKIALSVAVLAAAGIFINAVSNTNESAPKESEDLHNESEGVANVYALKIPDSLSFAGEMMPYDDPEVLERIDRELLVNNYWQSNALLLFKRAHKYFPVIEPILKEYGIPDDFKYLALIESGLQNVVSPAGATGFWQLMEPTAKELGLEVNSNVDERYNLKLSTEAACKYLLKSREKFDSWTLAAASYNAGQAGISKQLERQQVSNYYDLLLGQETGRYVFRILALKEILNHPLKYGFHFQEEDLYAHDPVYEVKVDTAVSDFVAFAKNYHINYKVLKRHNPWLRDTFLNNRSRKEYFIEIPEKGIYPQYN